MAPVSARPADAAHAKAHARTVAARMRLIDRKSRRLVPSMRGLLLEAQELERFDRLTGSLHFPARDYAGVKITPPADGGAPIRAREGSAPAVEATR